MNNSGLLFIFVVFVIIVVIVIVVVLLLTPSHHHPHPTLPLNARVRPNAGMPELAQCIQDCLSARSCINDAHCGPESCTSGHCKCCNGRCVEENSICVDPIP